MLLLNSIKTLKKILKKKILRIYLLFQYIQSIILTYYKFSIYSVYKL